jgi:hypothetical protein
LFVVCYNQICYPAVYLNVLSTRGTRQVFVMNLSRNLASICYEAQ